MKYLRVTHAETGQKSHYPGVFVPRIGERILLTYETWKDGPVVAHYMRVKDVLYVLDNPVDDQVNILVEDEDTPTDWHN